MSINSLIAIAILALVLFLAGPGHHALRYLREVHEAKQRRRHAVRRRAQRKGYVPVFDDRWEPRP